MKKKQFAVIGLGIFGMNVAKTLFANGQEVLAIDTDEAIVEDAKDFVTEAVALDATDEKALSAAGINDVDVAIITIGDIEASILVTLILREMGVKEVIARATSEKHGQVLNRVGATRVVFPEKDMAEKIANSMLGSRIIEHLDISPDYSIFEVAAPKTFCDKTLQDLNVRAEYEVNIIAVKKNDGTVIVTPGGLYKVEEGDTLIVIGTDKGVENLK
jgi:trk system potassium uptake protein TrkA